MKLIERFKAWRERRYWQRQHMEFVRNMVNDDWRWLGANPIADALTTRYRAALCPDWYQRQHEHVSDLRDRLRKLHGEELFKIPGAAPPGDEIRLLCSLKNREAITANLLRLGRLNKHHARRVAEALLDVAGEPEVRADASLPVIGIASTQQESGNA